MPPLFPAKQAGRFRRRQKQTRPAGLEPATPGLGNRCSIRLSYERGEMELIVWQSFICCFGLLPDEVSNSTSWALAEKSHGSAVLGCLLRPDRTRKRAGVPSASRVDSHSVGVRRRWPHKVMLLNWDVACIPAESDSV